MTGAANTDELTLTPGRWWLRHQEGMWDGLSRIAADDFPDPRWAAVRRTTGSAPQPHVRTVTSPAAWTEGPFSSGGPDWRRGESSPARGADDDPLVLTATSWWLRNQHVLRAALTRLARREFADAARHGGPAAPRALPPAIGGPLAVTPEEAASTTGVAEDAVREAAAAGQLPAARLGKRLLVPKGRLHELGQAAQGSPR